MCGCLWNQPLLVAKPLTMFWRCVGSTGSGVAEIVRFAQGVTTVGESLLRVVQDLLRATTAPNNGDTPVQIPPPNF